MAFDFELLLVLLTLVTGIVWGWDKLRARRARSDGDDPAAHPVSWWVDLGRSLFPVILAVLVIRSFVAEPFRIPSGSMVPTLYTGDFILVNKFSYGLRLPALHSKIIDLGGPERGDVAVFRYPVDPRQDYVKRIVGLPGDVVSYRDKQLFINGEPLLQEDLGRYVGPEHSGPAQLVREHVDDRSYLTVLHHQAPARDFEYMVPAGHYFAMGDNRDQSSDSRYWGFVPDENLVGKAFMIWMSFNPERFAINWRRIGNGID